MAYYPLGARVAVGKPDTTGYNAGALTAAFTAAVLDVTVPVFEIFKIAVTTAVVGSGAKLLIGPHTFSVGPVGEGAEWDPAQAALVREGQDVYLLFSQLEDTEPRPKATIWLRTEVSR